LEGADALLPDIEAHVVIADKAYDAQEGVIVRLENTGRGIVIASKCCRKQPREYDRHLYQARHLIENFFNRLKALSRYRHPLRQDRLQLSRGNPPRRRSRLAQLMTRPNRRCTHVHYLHLHEADKCLPNLLLNSLSIQRKAAASKTACFRPTPLRQVS
jgi:hypothetical protein